MKVKIAYIILLIISFQAEIHAQKDTLSRVQIDTLIFGQEPYTLSQKFCISSTLKIYHKKETINFLYSNNQVLEIPDNPSSKLLKMDTLYAYYRYYEDILPDSIARKYESGIESKVSYISLEIPENPEDKLLIPSGLNYNGSFARGLTAGNSQSLVLNSSFNMQLEGKIGDNIDLRAVMSDANIPIQAEGTTQQLREFDQVFIELSRDKQKLTAGDYRLEKPEGYFINYSKKLKGMVYENQSIYSKKGNLSFSGSFAIAGGKFARNIVAIAEGNQGPYKLQGAENEQFIIVQSGTEKVYIDGELLVRGETNDYIIYYDRSELIFTEKRAITKDIRVIVEFEYLAQNYSRTISTANSIWTLKKHKIGLRLYNEQDNKNSAGVFELTEKDREFLSQIGDEASANFQSSVFLNPEFDENAVFYQLEIDISGDSILTYSKDPNVAKYQAFFTDLGANNGSYDISEDVNTNGRVYSYVGEGNGRYLPVRKLIAPESKQLYSLSDEYNYSKSGKIRAEISLSNFDKNLFSSVNSEDDLSYAGRLDWRHQFLVGKEKKNRLELEAFGEYLDVNFKFLNPFRNQEFSRDWNITNITELSNEIYAGSSLNYGFKNSHITYQFSTYQRDANYSGLRQKLLSNLELGSTKINVNSSYLNSNSTAFNSTFLRPRISVDKAWKKLSNVHTTIEYDGEYNNKMDAAQDTLITGSNEYDFIKASISSDETKKVQTSIYYSKRYDRIAFDRQQTEFANADNYGTSLAFQGKKQSVLLNVSYRVLETDEALDQAVKDAKNVLGGIDYQYSIFDGLIRGVSNINFNTGQEPKLEFDYREVGQGEGNYIWVDDGNGIQEKNEFQIAPFSDQGNFIQVSLYNNEFIQVYKQDYSQTLRYDPIKWKLSKQKWKKVAALLSSQTSLKLSRKDLQDEGIPTFEFVGIDGTNPDLVSYLSSVNQTLFWNRGNPSYDIQLNYLSNKNSILLTTGNELRDNEIISLKMRKNIKRKSEIELELSSKNRGLNNLNFQGNNYFLSGWESILSSKYRILSNAEVSLSAEYGGKTNVIGVEKSEYYDIQAGVSYSGKEKIRVDGNLSFNRINYQKGANPTIELIMLEGLKNGNNYLWELRFTKRLMNNFDLTLNYNGRKTGDTRIIHVGNAQIKASF